MTTFRTEELLYEALLACFRQVAATRRRMARGQSRPRPAYDRPIPPPTRLESIKAAFNAMLTGRSPTRMHPPSRKSPRRCPAKKQSMLLQLPIPPTLAQCHRSYTIEIVQHPVKTAEFGDGTLTRLPLAPPLIARLVISGVSDVEAVE